MWLNPLRQLPDVNSAERSTAIRKMEQKAGSATPDQGVEALERALHQLQSCGPPSVAGRRSVLKTLRSVSTATANACRPLLMEILWLMSARWQDQRSSRFPLQLVFAWSQHPVFLKTLLSTLVRASTRTLTSPSLPLFRLLRWSLHAVGSAPADSIAAMSGKALEALATAHVQILEGYAQGNQNCWERLVKDFSYAWRREQLQDVLVPLYLKLVEKKTVACFGTVRLLLEWCKRLPLPQQQRWRERLVPPLTHLYIEHVLGANKPAHEFARCCAFRVLLQDWVTPETMKTFIAEVERMFKRAPATVVPAFASLLALTQTDCSHLHEHLALPLLSELANSDEKRSNAASNAIEALIRRTSDVARLGGLADEIGEYLQAKRVALGHWHQRLQFVRSLRMLFCADAVGQRGLCVLLVKVLNILGMFVRKEAHVEVRNAVFETVAVWLELIPDAQDAAAAKAEQEMLALMQSEISKRAPSMESALVCFLKVMRARRDLCGQVRTSASPDLLPALQRLIDAAEARSVKTRAAGVHSLALLFHLGFGHIDALGAARIEESPFYEAARARLGLLGEESFVVDLHLIGTGTDEFTPQLSLCQVVVESVLDRGFVLPASLPFFRSVIAAILDAHWQGARTALRTLEALFRSHPQLALHVLPALSCVVDELTAAEEFPNWEPPVVAQPSQPSQPRKRGKKHARVSAREEAEPKEEKKEDPEMELKAQRVKMGRELLKIVAPRPRLDSLLRHLLRVMCFSCSRTCAEPQLLCDVLFLAHHPLLTTAFPQARTLHSVSLFTVVQEELLMRQLSGRTRREQRRMKRSVWNVVLAVLAKGNETSEDALVSALHSPALLFFLRRGLASASHMQRRTTAGVLAFMAAHSRMTTVLARECLPLLCEALDMSEVKALSAVEVDVMFALPGELVLSHKLSADGRAVVTKNVKNHDQLEWEAKVREELEHEKRERAAREERERLLAEQAVMRARVQALKERLEDVATAAADVVESNPVFACEFILPRLLPPLHALLGSKLLAPHVTAQLVRCGASLDESVKGERSGWGQTTVMLGVVSAVATLNGTVVFDDSGVEHRMHAALKVLVSTLDKAPPSLMGGRFSVGCFQLIAPLLKATVQRAGPRQDESELSPLSQQEKAQNVRALLDAVAVLAIHADARDVNTSSSQFVFEQAPRDLEQTFWPRHDIIRLLLLVLGLPQAWLDDQLAALEAELERKTEEEEKEISWPSLGLEEKRSPELVFVALSRALKAVVPLSQQPEHFNSLLNELGVLNALPRVRVACVEALLAVPELVKNEQVTTRIWLLCHDGDEHVATLAKQLWDRGQFALRPDFVETLLPFLSNASPHVREAAGFALAQAGALFPEHATQFFSALMRMFKETHDVEADEGTRAQTTSRAHVRCAVAHCLGACTQTMMAASDPGEQLRTIFVFFLEHGLADANEQVWQHVLSAGLELVDFFGKQFLHLLLPLFEEGLVKHSQFRDAARESRKKAMRAADAIRAENARNSATSRSLLSEMSVTRVNIVHAASKKQRRARPAAVATTDCSPSHVDFQRLDRIHEGTVIFLGQLARFLEPGDKVLEVVNRLVDVLQTPSEAVQSAVAQCLPVLVPSIPEEAPRMLQQCFETSVTGETFGDRKGGAFGLAAIVKGLRLPALKRLGVLDKLQEYAEGKTWQNRQGAMFCIARLFSELGAPFEPYVVKFLPLLLKNFGDSNGDVRAATQETARVVMAKLTQVGVKMVLPQVLGGLDAPAWRTRIESINLLGAMAYLAPHQLAISLPRIVPRLLEVLADPHKKVQEAAAAALQQIGSVIRNPEILAIVPDLLGALANPLENTQNALQALIGTSFVHSVDPPSLALLIPVLVRGMRSRGAATKKTAAQVVGSICSLLADVKDILPYVTELLNCLKAVAVAPRPDERLVGARALGSLVKGLGEKHFSGLVEWLLEMLRSSSAVEREGAAQALGHVFLTLGTDRVGALLPSTLQQLKNPKPNVREGYFCFLDHMARSFGPKFGQFLEPVFPAVLEGLADETSVVQEVATAAAQSLVCGFISSHTELILDSLQDAIISSSWRIREASSILIGGALRLLGGVRNIVFLSSRKGQSHNEEKAGDMDLSATKKQMEMVRKALGEERSDRALAGLYLMRSDLVQPVRSTAWRVWKSVVANKPKTLRKILPVLMEGIINDLSEGDVDKQQAASVALGDLVSKMGDVVLEDLIPFMQNKLRDPDVTVRRGVCLGLSEVLASTHKSFLAVYLGDLIPTVRSALCDELAEVREAAGAAFIVLFRIVGKKAITDVVPHLLSAIFDLREGHSVPSLPHATVPIVLQALRQTLQRCPQLIVPLVVRAFTPKDFTTFHANCLGTLADRFAGGSFFRHVSLIMERFMEALASPLCSPESAAELMESARFVLGTIEQDSVSALLMTLVEFMDDTEQPRVQEAALRLLCVFLEDTNLPLELHTQVILGGILRRYVEPELAELARTALKLFIHDENAVCWRDHLAFIRSTLLSITVDQQGRRVREHIHALCVKQGLVPLLGVMVNGLRHGAPQIRLTAAICIGELIEFTDAKSLRSHINDIAGPLVRVVGDRNGANVKTAILHTLALLIPKASIILKAFVPALQSTFSRALHDPSESVRREGATALGHLLPLSRRVDPLVKEITSHAQGGTETDVQASMFVALAAIVKQDKVAAKLSAPVMDGVRSAVFEHMLSAKEPVRVAAARAFGAATRSLTTEQLQDVVTRHLTRDAPQWQERQARLLAFVSLLHDCPHHVGEALLRQIYNTLVRSASDDNLVVNELAAEVCCDAICSAVGDGLENPLLIPREQSGPILSEMLQVGLGLLTHEVAQVRQAMALAGARMAVSCRAFVASQRVLIAKAFTPALKDSSQPVRAAAQRILFCTLGFLEGREQGMAVGQGVVAKLEESGHPAVAQTLSTALKGLSKLRVVDVLAEQAGRAEV